MKNAIARLASSPAASAPVVDYTRLYAESLRNPDAFWGGMAKELLTWDSLWDKVCDCDFTEPRVSWFAGGRLNVSVNCLDRHLVARGNKPALVWEPDEEREQPRVFSYRQLHEEVCRAAHALVGLGVRPGDRVCLYMPMIPEAAIAMLACARIGAIHAVVFAGFSVESLRERLRDTGARVLITADEGRRGGKHVPLKALADAALEGVDEVTQVLVVKATGAKVPMKRGRDRWWHSALANQPAHFEPVMVEANTPLFILYTSGSTGKPKGIVHGSGGYLLHAALSHRMVFDLREEDVFWCTADIGWITGHSYLLYGPLCNGATTVMYEGVPQHPDWDRMWKIVDRHGVTSLYTAPTLIRALQAQGDHYVRGSSRASLRVLGSVGEPINPEAWRWFHDVVGEGRCPIADTWWQTETGGHLIAPLANSTKLKPGSATMPFFGVEPVLLDENGERIEGMGRGYLCMARSWPGQMLTIWGNPERFRDGYFGRFPGYYFSGDGCVRDDDGYYWITGRVDDILNVSGHRLSTAEIEATLALHPAVAEAAVVGVPHPIKGEGVYAFVMLHRDALVGSHLGKELNDLLRSRIGPIATADVIQMAPALPKTRSGKIMRRILRKIAAGEEEFGDTSTLADPSVVAELAQKPGLLVGTREV